MAEVLDLEIDPISDGEDDTYSSELDDDLKDSIEQLERVLCLVVFPLLGKFLGRKFAFHGKLV